MNAMNPTEGIRLAKRVADILKCSRSEAEQVIVGAMACQLLPGGID